MLIFKSELSSFGLPRNKLFECKFLEFGSGWEAEVVFCLEGGRRGGN
jgi:hypothetical protein